MDAGSTLCDRPPILDVVNAAYHGSGVLRYRCLGCAGKGSPGEDGLLTGLSGTIFEGTHEDVRTLWLIIGWFVARISSVQAADAACVNRHISDQMYRPRNAMHRGALMHGIPESREGSELA